MTNVSQPRVAIVAKSLLVLAIGITLNLIPFRVGPGQWMTGLPLPFGVIESLACDGRPAPPILASFATVAVNALAWCWMALLIASQRLWTCRTNDGIQAPRWIQQEILLLAVLLLLAGSFLPIWMRHPDFAGMMHGHSVWTEPHEH